VRSLFLALSLVGCAASFPTPPPPPTLDNYALPRFDKVGDGVYRSSQPSADNFRELVARYGIKTVVKLNTGSDDAPPGVKVALHPLSPLSEIPASKLKQILDDIDAAEKPVLIHCTHGEDRTGLVVALYKMRHGTRMEDAYVDMIRHGFHPYSGLWTAWVKAAGW
jgi:protein tyrosine/serine phosphatase